MFKQTIKVFILVIAFLGALSLTIKTCETGRAKQPSTCRCNDNKLIIVDDCSECSSKCGTAGYTNDPNNCLESGDTSGGTAPPQEINLKDPLGIDGEEQGVQILIGKIIKAIMGLVGSVALLMFVYGGFIWMTAAGNEEKVQKGKDIFVWAVWGLSIIFASYLLVHFVLTSLMM